MIFYDTHFHLPENQTAAEFLERIDADLQTAADFTAEPVQLRLLAAAGSLEQSFQVRDFAHQVPGARYAAGIHPHDAGGYSGDREDFRPFFGDPLLAAVGEIGLDYFYHFTSPDLQRSVFADMLLLAGELQLPAMIHLRDEAGSRQAYADALELLRPFAAGGGRFVIHCYAGSAADAAEFLQLGGYFGVTGLYTFRGAANVREALREVPDDRLLTETDSPYLTPVPYRGRENTPGLVPLVVRALGADRGLVPEQAAAVFGANARRFYRWED